MENNYNMPVAGSQAAKRLALGNKRLPTQTIVMRTLYAIGVTGMPLIAPNVIKQFPAFNRSARNKRRDVYRRIDQALYRLKKRKLVEFTDGNVGRPVVQLTEDGKKMIEKLVLCEYRISEMPVWDGKWRIIIFDIKEKRRRIRERLRTLLFGAGFVRLQDSVWVVPYPCDEFVQLVRAHLASGTGELLAFVAEGLEADRRLREHFGLL